MHSPNPFEADSPTDFYSISFILKKDYKARVFLLSIKAPLSNACYQL